MTSAEEIFLTNSIQEIVPVTKHMAKSYEACCASLGVKDEH